MEWWYRYYYRGYRYIVMDTFKGLSWLFEELSKREPRDFSDYNQPPAIPYSFGSFLIFLENIIHDDDPLLGRILPFPNEIPKK